MTSLDAIRNDTDHGAAQLARWGLVALGGFGERDDALAIATACRLATLRPAMAPIAYWAARFAEGVHAGGAPRAVADGLIDEMERFVVESVAGAQPVLAGAMRIVTHSWSSTVMAMIVGAAPKGTPILVGESRPLQEGRKTAQRAFDAGFAVTLGADAVLPGLIRPGDILLLGADTIMGDGSFVNKSGSYPLALAAREVGTPVWVAADRSKIVPADRAVPHEEGAPDMIWSDHPALCRNPTFERVPPPLVTGYLTERGAVDSAAIQKEADQTARLFDWFDDYSRNR